MNLKFRSICLLSVRGIKQFGFSSIVASLAISIAGGLFLSTWKIKEGAQNAFSLSSGGFDAVLGARGAKLQLILNAIFHLEDSPGNLDWEQYVETSERYFRPNEVDYLLGDYSKAKKKLGWKPSTSFDDLVKMMVESDLLLAEREKVLIDKKLLKPTWEK